MQEENATFNPVSGLGNELLTYETVDKLLKSYMKEGTKISKDGSVAAAELLRMFVVG